VVVSSLAIHNISGSRCERKPSPEAVGCCVLASVDDRRHSATRQHERQSLKLGMSEVACRRLGWRFWWGGPWGAPSRDRHKAGMSELSRHDTVHGRQFRAGQECTGRGAFSPPWLLHQWRHGESRCHVADAGHSACCAGRPPPFTRLTTPAQRRETSSSSHEACTLCRSIIMLAHAPMKPNIRA